MSVRTTCPYCGVGCGLVVTRDASGVEVAGDREHPANFGRLCSKGSALAGTLGHEQRLVRPEIDGRPVDWDAALTHVADGFNSTIERHGSDAVAFYVSGQLLTEDYYVANKLMKGFIGSGNIDTNSRLCMASAVAAYQRAFGSDTVPNAYSDLETADLVILVGSNLAWCHPVLFQRLRAAKAQRPDLHVVVVDPRRTPTCEIADTHLAIAPGTDVTLFNGLLSYLRREDALDWEFLDEHATGFGAAMRVARDSAAAVPEVARACGVPERDVAELYRRFASTPNVVTAFSQGVNQSTSGTDKANSIVNVHLATGRIGRPGAGPFSITGQPNAMGGREVGGLATQLAAHMGYGSDNVDRLRRFWGTSNVAERPGLKAVDLFDAVESGRIKALWIMATNPVVSMPDADRVRAALERCELVVVSDMVRNSDTVECADVVLPAAGWGEKSGTVTNSERRISRQRAFLEPPGEARPDSWVVTEVARRMGFAHAFDYAGPADIFREHARLSAFENDGTRAFDIGALSELSDAEYDALEPMQWPCPAGAPASRPFADGRFYTESGRARLVVTEPRVRNALPDADYPLVLNTGRVRDQWHTMTRTARVPRLNGHVPEPTVDVHPSDALRFGVTPGALARIESVRGAVVVRVDTSESVRPGHVFVPMHWNDQFSTAARVGALIAPATDPESGQPELKATPVRMQPYVPAWHGFVLSREPRAFPDASYCTEITGAGFMRYELAGERAPPDWGDWARRTLGTDGEWLEYADREAGRYRGARIDGDTLAACVFVAPTHHLPARRWLEQLMQAPLEGSGWRASVLAGRPADPSQEGGALVCACFGVGRRTLVDAIRRRGLDSVEAIGRALGAGTNCGSCTAELDSLLSQARAPDTVA